MFRKNWKFCTVDTEEVQHLADELELPFPIARILVQRGFSDAVSARLFMNPRLADLADPGLLPDMEAAVQRIWTGIERHEKMAVFGDYDVDGVTSSALLLRLLTALGASVVGFIPDRLDEGYGLSQDALDRCLSEHGPSLLVSVDCGTNSVTSVERARQRGIDVIVTDHHEPDDAVAPSLALINPKLGTHSELEILSGVGVAFKLAHALVKEGRERGNPEALAVDLRQYMDIAALGTVADIVPLVGENRILVRHGLAQLEDTRWVGMDALKEVAGIRGRIDTGHLGFQLGPRINAAGRIGQPMQALRLLTTNNALEARNIANLLNRNNQERRDIERNIAQQAFEEIDTYYDPEQHFGLVVAGAGWHPGVVGIVASRVSRHYNRPAIIMSIEEDGRARGSCRSIDAYDILTGLQACEAHLDKFGGHKMAAGLEVKPGEIETFRRAFNAAARESLAGVDLSPIQYIDAVVDAGELDHNFYEQLSHLRPFGQDNAEPVWALCGVEVAGLSRVVGHKHLKFVIQAGSDRFDAIAFNFPQSDLPTGRIDVAFTLKENCWNGNSTLQLHVQDVRSSSDETCL